MRRSPNSEDLAGSLANFMLRRTIPPLALALALAVGTEHQYATQTDDEDSARYERHSSSGCRRARRNGFCFSGAAGLLGTPLGRCGDRIDRGALLRALPLGPVGQCSFHTSVDALFRRTNTIGQPAGPAACRCPGGAETLARGIGLRQAQADGCVASSL